MGKVYIASSKSGLYMSAPERSSLERCAYLVIGLDNSSHADVGCAIASTRTLSAYDSSCLRDISSFWSRRRSARLAVAPEDA